MEARAGVRNISEGRAVPLRLGGSAKVVSGRAHGRYREQSIRGNLFVGGNELNQTMKVQNTRNAACAIYNPPGSGKYVSLVRWEMTIDSSNFPSLAALGIYVTVNLSQTAITDTPGIVQAGFVRQGFVQTNGFGNPYTKSSLLLPAAIVYDPLTYTGGDLPTIFRVMSTQTAGVATTIPGLPSYAVEFDGTCIMSPGTLICCQQTAGSINNVSSVHAIVWEEISIQ